MVQEIVQQFTAEYLSHNYNWAGQADQVIIQRTRKEFEGDMTIVLFPFVKLVKQPPAQLGEALGLYLEEKIESVQSFNVVKGFLNLSLTDKYWIQRLYQITDSPLFGKGENRNEKVVVEYCSPNTNKPIHLGHIRNILLGISVSNILEEAGYDVTRTQVINDRGIAICKSMVAWKKYSENATPSTTGQKGDVFVGEYYVRFEREFAKEYREWQNTLEAEKVYRSRAKETEERDTFFARYKNEYFNQFSRLGAEAKDMLQRWEKKEEKILRLWERMNHWVYEGFEQTFQRIGAHFDKNYYESDTYVMGKKIVEQGLANDQFYQEEDGSIWVDLEDRTLDKKILLRADGTSLYITQDIGTAIQRKQDFDMDRMIYVVGNEQEYHFQVLFAILEILGYSFASHCHHLSYGMVELPEGKMKSREGKVVDADDLMDEVINEVERNAVERGELDSLSVEQRKEIYRKVGLAALKFFILKVNPQRTMIFNPAESVDLQGQTGPYIQNAFVRIKSILRKLQQTEARPIPEDYQLAPQERALLLELNRYPDIVQQAADKKDPSEIAVYCYELAKLFHQFYHDISVAREKNQQVKQMRLVLIQAIASVLEKGMKLLGIEMPERM